MNKTGIKWLYQELPELISRGVLAPESADKLRQYYGEVKSTSKTTPMLIILGTLGSLLIGLGIILLLAHNWEQFSRFTRTILSFAPLVLGQGLALWVLKNKSESGAFKEGAATFLSLMVGASLSLISQTYHLPTDANIFVLTWMFLIIPLTYLMQASIPVAIYLVGITIWAGLHWHDPVKAVLFWPLAALVLPHFLWSLRQEAYALRSTILSFIGMICICFAAGFSLGKTWPGYWVILFPSLYSIFYLLGCLETSDMTTNWQRPLRLIGAIGLFILAFQFTFRYVWNYLGVGFQMSQHEVSPIATLPDQLITIALVATAAVLFYRQVKRKNLTVCLMAAVPWLALLSYLARAGSGNSAILPALIFNVYLFVLSIYKIFTGFRSNKMSTVNIGMLMLAILILARFLDSDIGFVIKGLAFILIGIGFLVVNLQLSRRLGGVK